MEEKGASFKHDAIPLLFLVAMVLWFNHELLLTGKIPFFRDLGPFFYPMRFSLAESLHASELPLWNRHIGMGYPLMANFQSGVFYLPHLSFIVLPFFWANAANFLLHYFVAAFGAYMLCRQWRYPPYLAVVGAILFTLGGTIVSLSNLLNHFQTAVWLPWVILVWEKLLQRQSWGRFIVFTSVCLLQFLAGSPEFYAMTMGLALLDGLRWKAAEGGPSYSKIFLLLLVVNLTTLCLAMIQLLPTLELIRESRTKFPIPLQLATRWSLNPWHLINLFLLDREVVPERISGMEILFVPELPFFVSYYMGAFTLIGFCLWLYYASWKEKTALLGVMTISLVLALGTYTPIYAFLFRHVRFFDMFRFPEKFFYIIFSILIFIVLRGLAMSLQRTQLATRGMVLISAIAGVLIALYFTIVFGTPLIARFISSITQSPFLSDSTLLKTSMAVLSVERQITLILGIIAILFLRLKNVLRNSLFSTLLIAIVFLDLYSAHQSYQYLLKPDFIYDNPRILQRPDSEPNRIFYYPGQSNLHPSYYSLLRKPSFAEFNAVAFSNLLPNSGVFHGFEYMQELDGLIRWPYNAFLVVANQLSYDRLVPLLSVFNVRYVYSFRPLPEHDGVELLKHFEEHPSWLYRLKQVVPRTYVVPRMRVEKNPFVTLNLLAGSQIDPMREVILESALPMSQKAGFNGKVEIVAYESARVEVRASLNDSGILVLADSFYPGWKVYVDGNEEQIVRANLFFRAVPLTAGLHAVEFRYDPRSFTLGLVISLATICGLIAISVCRYLFQHKKQPTNMPT